MGCGRKRRLAAGSAGICGQAGSRAVRGPPGGVCLAPRQRGKSMAVVTISRQFGAGGKTLGQRIANRLSYQFVHGGVLQKLAQEADVSLTWVDRVQSERGGYLTRLLNTLVPSSVLEKRLGDDEDSFDEKRLAEFLNTVIAKLAEEDEVVILGRGSQFVLRQHPGTLRVLLVAEKADRVKFVIDNYGLEPKKAEQLVAKEEERRKGFLSTFYGGNPDEACLYHLVVNTSEVPMGIAEAIVCDLVAEMVDREARPIW